ncbi:MAG: sigma-E factor negative regulatory protein [Zoogloeaceae bacterium]|nr:sigma-E factor negative regulatory protein [Zoogloeaceae bacterium]
MKEKLSSLLDGDVEPGQSAVFEALRKDPALRGQWDAYCLIGDALRGEHAHHPDFVSRVMAGLDAEPTLLAPPPRKPLQALTGRPAMAIAASVMGVVAVGLVAFSMVPATQPDSVPVAGLVATAPAGGSVQRTGGTVQLATTLGEDSHREYLFVHQAMSGGGPIPGAVHYVRTVSDTRGEQR